MPPFLRRRRSLGMGSLDRSIDETIDEDDVPVRERRQYVNQMNGGMMVPDYTDPSVVNSGYPVQDPMMMNGGYQAQGPIMVNGGYPAQGPGMVNGGYPAQDPMMVNGGYPAQDPMMAGSYPPVVAGHPGDPMMGGAPVYAPPPADPMGGGGYYAQPMGGQPGTIL